MGRMGILVVAAVVGAAGAGCGIEFTAQIIDDDTGVAADQTEVRFRNVTPYALHVEFYATNGAVQTLPGDLFAAENLITAGIGTGGTGVLGPGTSDVVTLSCAPRLVLGTTGGTFVDPDSGAEIGLGTEQYLQQTITLCGREVTITYREADAGTFETQVSVD